ncbi:unnamed protein product [Amoebophrya sp. A25]|nr:unnamed protein product [Amoebophrya sp. A25]|eukprot:GSA25T00009186001.1
MTSTQSGVVYSAEVKARAAVIVEEAKTSRSSCRVCRKPIEQNCLRVGVPAFVSGRLVTAYQHPECFIRNSVEFGEVDSNGAGACKATKRRLRKGELRCIVQTGNSRFSLSSEAFGLLRPALSAGMKSSGSKVVKKGAMEKIKGVAKLMDKQRKQLMGKLKL